MKRFLYPIFLCLLPMAASAQTVFRLFKPSAAHTHEALENVQNATLLQPDTLIWKRLISDRPAQVVIQLPFEGGMLALELERCEITSEGFRIIQSDAANCVYTPGLHYRGKIAGATQSMAALSIFENGIMGVLADAEGNINVGRIENSNQYVIFREKNLKRHPAFECGVSDENLPVIAEQAAQFAASNCIKVTKIYVECTYQTYLENGSSSVNTVDFVTGLFNIVAAFYAQEQVTIQLSELFIWTSADNYPTAATLAHGAFSTTRPNYNGNFAHLIDIRNPSTGGWANVSTGITCNNSYAFSSIYNTYAYLPVYSWSVTVMAHETGHNFGSRHTHWCGWPGGPIDNCYPVEGNCAPGPAPQGGGTVMSYCYLQPGGVNLSKGLGEHPGNLIRQRVYEATCIFSDPPVPGAEFTWVRNGDSFKFFAPEAPGVVYTWDFGDGAGSSLPNPEHTFQKAGLYPVCLKVGNACGEQNYCANIPVDYCWQWALPKPQGNIINDVAYNANGRCFLVGNGGQIIASDTEGNNWYKVPANTTDSLFEIQFPSPSIGYIIGSGDYLLKTTDGGDHWRHLPYNYPFSGRSLSFIDSINGWVAGDGGIVLQTQDGGLNWTKQNTQDIQTIRDIKFVNSQRGWLFRQNAPPQETTNGGLTWQVSALPLNTTNMHFWNSQQGWFWGDNKFHTTNNSGQTWVKQNSVKGNNIMFFLNRQKGWKLTHAQFSDTLWVSSNGGLSWSFQQEYLPVQTKKLAFFNTNKGAITYQNIYFKSTTNGKNWKGPSISYVNPYSITCVSFANANNGYAASDNIILKTTDGGIEWKYNPGLNLYGVIQMEFTDSLNGWAISHEGAMKRTKDAGMSWQTVTIANYLPGTSGFSILSDNIHCWVLAGNNIVYKTENSGNSWTSKSIGYNNITLQGIHFFNKFQGMVYGTKGTVLYSIDSGDSWTEVYNNSAASFRCHAFVDSLYGWLAGDNGLVAKTQDGGLSWSICGQVNTKLPINKLFFLDAFHGWCSDGGKLYYSADGGNKWITVDTGSEGGVGAFHFFSTNKGVLFTKRGNALRLGVLEAPKIYSNTVTVCKNVPLPEIYAEGMNLLWYNVPTGGVGYTSDNIPIDNSNVGMQKIYVSQTPIGTEGCGESPRAEIDVIIDEIKQTTLPTVTICAKNLPYISPWGDAISQSTTMTRRFETGVCDSFVTLDVFIINEKQTNLGKINRCTGDTLFVCGEPYTQSGNYNKLCTSYQGCDSTVTFELLVRPSAATHLNTQYRCANDPLIIGNDTLSTSGPFSITLSAHNGCDSVVSGTLVLLQAAAQISGPSKICPGDTLTLFSVFNPPATQRIWRDASGNILGHTDSLHVAQAGTYYLEARVEAAGAICSVFDTLNLVAAPLISNLSLNAGPRSCAEAGFIIAASPDPGLSFRWNGPYGWQSDKAFNFVEAAGWYHVTATNAQGCTATGSINVPGENLVASFSLSTNPVELDLQAPALTSAALSADVQNLYSGTVQIYWERTFLDLSPDCALRVEDPVNYHPVDVKSGMFPVAAGATVPLRAHLLDDADEACCGIIRLLLLNTCTQSDTLTLTYLAHCSSATNDASSGATLKVVPNPGAAWFELQGNLPAGAQKIRIFAIDGRLVLSEQISPDRRFSLVNAAAGTYFIVLENQLEQALWVGEVLKL
jgi:photosystem II stability/assembly factor-like uncharacterized protein